MIENNYINTNYLTYVAKDFFDRHKLINSVVVANVEDFKAIPSPNYPIVNIEPVDSAYNGDLVTQGFVITIADIMTEKHTGEGVFRIQDNMSRIANDAIVYLQNQLDFDGSPIVNVNPFEEEGSDRTAGVVFRMNLIYHRDNNPCMFDNLLDITVPFYLNIEDRAVQFYTWILHPNMNDYEITFDGGLNWETMIEGNVYQLEDKSYPLNSIGQRIKDTLSFSNATIWNNIEVPENE